MSFRLRLEMRSKCHESSANAIMKPRLIVALGAPASRYLGADYKRRESEPIVAFGGHRTRLIAAVHTSAWTWGSPPNNGFGEAQFRAEGPSHRRRFKKASRRSVAHGVMRSAPPMRLRRVAETE
jgi:hypothetical protein